MADDLGLEYKIGFDTETDGLDATQRIIKLNEQWEAFMLANPIHVKFDTSAYTQQNNSGGGNNNNGGSNNRGGGSGGTDNQAKEIMLEQKLADIRAGEVDTIFDLTTKIKEETKAHTANMAVQSSTIEFAKGLEASINDNIIAYSKLALSEQGYSKNKELLNTIHEQQAAYKSYTDSLKTPPAPALEKTMTVLENMSAYYRNLEVSSKEFYAGSNQANKNSALEGLSARLVQINKEIADVEYNLLGITDKKKPRADTTVQLQWIDDLKKEAVNIQSAMNALDGLKMGGDSADIQKINSGLTETNFELLQMKEHYQQLSVESAKLVKNALSKTNTTDVLGMKEGSIDEIDAKITRLAETTKVFYDTAKKVGFDDDKLNGAAKRANGELDRLIQKMATLKASFGNRSLDSLLAVNPKSIQEANALMSELAKRRDALNRSDGNYINNITSINKKQGELSAQNAKDLQLGVQKTQQIHAENAAYDKQSVTMQNLKNAALQYLSIYEGMRLIKNIAQITGEFELQRVSLAAILRDADKADEIFGRIKSLAIVSPFTFKDLMSYTKQLAAYRIETDQLYDTTKNLADVSAGLGVDMSRIILAYGQVSAASVLRGQELRQFTEAGIPLVSLLADKFTELEGRVVSTGEVFGKISNRLVPFQMVKDVFSDMSSEGGIFFNMQEIQSTTLAGKISNLTDAYQLMFNSIGSGGAVNSVLKGGVDLLMNMAKNWESVGASILPVVSAIGVYKAASVWMTTYQSAQTAYYGVQQGLVAARIAYNEKEIALEIRKTGVQNAALIFSKAKAASDAVSVQISALSLTTSQKEVAALIVKNLVLEAGTDKEKLANLEKAISSALQLKGIGVTAADIAAKGALAAANDKVTVSLWAMMAANPALWIAGIVAAIGAVVAALVIFYNNSNKLKNELGKLGSAGDVQASDLAGRFTSLAKTVTSSTSTIEEQNSALKILRQVYKDILPDQLLTIEGLKGLKGNYDTATASIYEYIAAKTKEKQIEAINTNSQDNITPVYDKIIKGLERAGASASTAKSAMIEFQKEITNGQMKGMNAAETFSRLQQIVKDISGKDVENMKSAWYLPAFDTTLYNAGELTKLLGDQKKTIDDLNNTNITNYYYNFSAGMKAVNEDIKKTTGALEQGVEVVNGKRMFFKESFYEFDQRKSAVEKTKLLDYLRSLMDDGQKILSRPKPNWDIFGIFGNKDGGFGLDKVTGDLKSQLAKLDLNSFQQRVNSILLSGGANNSYTKSYDALLITSANKVDTTTETLEKFKLANDETTKSIKAANNAISDAKKIGNYNPIDSQTMDAFDINGKRMQVTWKMELDGYTKYVKDKAVYVTGLKQVNKDERAVLDDNGLGDDKDEKKAKKTQDERNKELIKSLEDRAAILKQANSEYDKLVKAGMSIDDAKTTTAKLFKGQLTPEQIPYTDAQLSADLKWVKGKIAAIPKGQQPAFKLGLDINGIDTKIITDQLQAKLKSIEAEFNTSKKRIDLFKNIFDVTSDYDLAGRIAQSFEGKGTTDIETAMKKALSLSFDEVGIKMSQLSDDKGNLDYVAAQKAIDTLSEGNKKTALQKQFEISKDFKEKEYIALFKGLEQYKTFESKRADIIRLGLIERAKIENDSIATPEQKTVAIKQSSDKQSSDIAKNTMEQFKGSDQWTMVFSDLDKVSQPVILRLQNQLEDFKNKAGKDLPIAEFRELTKVLSDLQNRTSTIGLGDFIKAFTTDYKIPDLVASLKAANEEKDRLMIQNTSDVANQVIAKTKSVSADKELSLDPTNLDKLDASVAAQNELDIANKRASESTRAYTAAVKEAEKANNGLSTAQNAKIVATANFTKGNDKLIQGFSEIKNAIDSTVSAFYSVADAMGIAISPETKEILDGITKGLGAVIAVLTAVGAIVVLVGSTAWVALAPIMVILAPIIAALAIVVGIFAILKATKLNPINDQLEEQQAIVDGLAKQYTELERKMGDALGSDWLVKYNEELANTQSQIAAISKQLELEQSKGKDAKDEDIKKFQDDLESQRLIAEESVKKLQQFVSGTDLSSAAKDFSSAWLDAYKSFGNTSDAMQAKFKDMMNNMILNTLMAEAMKVALTPVFDLMKEYAGENSDGGTAYTPAELAALGKEGAKDVENGNVALTAIAETMKANGVDLRDTSTNLQGVSKGISGITEETANLLGGYLDSIRMKLFTYIDMKSLEKPYDFKSGMAGLLAGQGTQISHLVQISANTLKTADACNKLTDQLDKVTSLTGSRGAFSINVNA